MKCLFYGSIKLNGEKLLRESQSLLGIVIDINNHKKAQVPKITLLIAESEWKKKHTHTTFKERLQSIARI